MTKIVARLEGVTKVYPATWPRRGPVQAVSDVHLRLYAGQVVGLIGPNRAGKSTLAKLLLSLCRPSSGRVERFGRPASERRTLARVGYVHEEAAFPAHLNAAALLDDYAALSGVGSLARRHRIPELLKRVGLDDRAREPISRFSKGMSRRLALAQAIVNEPDLLILDEPFGGMDLAGRRLVEEVIRECRQRDGAVLLIAHELDEVQALCDRVVVMSQGRVVCDEATWPASEASEHHWERELELALVAASPTELVP